MSPSEERGLAQGIRMVSLTRARHAVLPPDAHPKTKVVVKFDFQLAKRRHELVVYARSRAGAWEAALRLARRLQRGEQS